VDLDIEVDMDRAAATDDMADTVDYGAVTDMVRRLVSTESCGLLEALAERIADVVLADPRVGSATVALRKVRPPVAADLRTAGVRITRGRPRP
jgi:dihydroneopterin aldolase